MIYERWVQCQEYQEATLKATLKTHIQSSLNYDVIDPPGSSPVLVAYCEVHHPSCCASQVNIFSYVGCSQSNHEVDPCSRRAIYRQFARPIPVQLAAALPMTFAFEPRLGTMYYGLPNTVVNYHLQHSQPSDAA